MFGGRQMPRVMESFGFLLSRTFATTKPRRREWPHVPGTYFVVDAAAPVAVTTLGSVALAEAMGEEPSPGLCIVGKLETENIGIEKIIKNVVSNPAIRYLVCAGHEPPKHLTGATMLALFENGMDADHRIPGAPGMRPCLPNTSPAEVQAFRSRVRPIDMIGCTDVAEIGARVSALAQEAQRDPPPAPPAPGRPQIVERVLARGVNPARIKLDKAGYFVIHVRPDGLLVEHYDYQEHLLRVVEGEDARSIYLTLTQNGWVTRLDHAAYLGKELARAQAAREQGIGFVQDGA